VEVGGKELHRFTWSAANETLVAENAPDVVLKVDYDPEIYHLRTIFGQVYDELPTW
jgi:hypothetical protein